MVVSLDPWSMDVMVGCWRVRTQTEFIPVDAMNGRGERRLHLHDTGHAVGYHGSLLRGKFSPRDKTRAVLPPVKFVC